jgi:acetyltransferase
MKKNKLDTLFNPKNIALVGASRDPSSVGSGILRNLKKKGVFYSEFNKIFKGDVFPINPRATEVLGLKCYPNIKNVKENIDLAVVAVPAKIVPEVMRDCAKKKVKNAIIISAGFAETGEKGNALQDEVLQIAKKSNIRIIGPNCLGMIRPAIGLNASFAPVTPPEGGVAFISQSGALIDSIVDWAVKEKYGFSTIVSYGNQADLGICDFLEWLENDDNTKSIALYIEGIKDGKRFMEIAKRVSQTKPIVVLKAGKTKKGSEAVASHTGNLAGTAKVYSAAFKQSMILEANNVEELFDMAKVLAFHKQLKENKIVIVSNAGGPAVLATDYCEKYGLNLVELKRSTINKMDETELMHPAYSKKNPLDLIVDALPERYDAAIEALLKEPYVQGLIVIQTLQTMTDSEKDAEVIASAQQRYPAKPIVCAFMGGKYTDKGVRKLESCGIPNYPDPERAVKAMVTLIKRKDLLNQ